MTTTTDTAPKTIARTATRKLAELQRHLKTCHSYTLDRGFIAEQIAAEWGWDQFSRGRGKLTVSADGTATLAFHSNFWLKYSAETVHFHAVDDSAAWSCKHAHPYATKAEAEEHATALHTDAPEYALTIVPCRKSLV